MTPSLDDLLREIDTPPLKELLKETAMLLGMATLSLDTKGQGETPERGLIRSAHKRLTQARQQLAEGNYE